MAIPWKNGGDQSVVDYRIGGPGNNWKVGDINSMVDAPSGGGRATSTLWGRGDVAGLQPRGIILTGNPDDFTFNLSYPLTNENFFQRFTCPLSIRVRQYCAGGRTNPVGYTYPGMLAYLQARPTKYGYDKSLAANDGSATDLNKTLAMSAALEQNYGLILHEDQSNSINDIAINRVINIGAEICYGSCGLGSTEEDSWLFVSDRDSSPTYVGQAAPWLYTSYDRMLTRNAIRIGTYVGADALDVVYTGSRAVVFSDTKPPTYALISDINNGVVDPNLWSFSTLSASESGSNYPKAAVAVDATTILAVGNGGRIWLSTDGGVSFTKIYDTAVLTSQNLLAIHAQPGGNAFAVGAAGTLIRLAKVPGQSSYSGSVIIVRDASLNVLSSTINSVRTPSTRGDEVYLGTAGGEIWRSRNINATKPVFTNMKFDKSGTGFITDMNFAGYQGDVLFVLQSAADGTSRVLRDLSGGALGYDAEAIGDFVTPGNFHINSIAPANVNMAVTVGEVHNSIAFVGMVRPQ